MTVGRLVSRSTDSQWLLPVENDQWSICIGTPSYSVRTVEITMTHTLEISDELKDRLDDHREEGESYEAFIAELVSMYETEGAFLQEGYTE